MEAKLKNRLRDVLAAGILLFCVGWGAYGGVALVNLLVYEVALQLPLGAFAIGFCFGGVGGAWVGSKVLNFIWHEPDEE